MNGDLIRRSFLEFFQSKGHTIMPSASLVPAGDPTLLFTSAGMVPFKPFFMGESTPSSRRLTSCQKSFRTTDIDEVGDHKHLTFFEMLGNFSIGDYFKKDAIPYAWEFVTQQLKLLPERLYVTIYLDDEEAFAHWSQDIGVPTERIYRYGDKDNWWGPAGKEGPCGPCSEIHYDGGHEYGCSSQATPDEINAWAGQGEQPGCHPNCDNCERFVELWNLVFMQFYQDLEGKRTPLPAPSIDTGLGLERAAAILQNKRNLYETDLFWPIVEKACELTGRTYGQDKDTDYALRVVAEHGRAASFLIADGVVPGNDGRGYVLRRIIRRAIRYGRRLGLDTPFLTIVAEAAIERFQQVYTELSTQRDFIVRVVGLEEERFGEAYGRGIGIFNGMVKYRKKVVACYPEEIFDERGGISYPGTLVSTNDDENTGAVLAHMAMIDEKDRMPGIETSLWFQKQMPVWANLITGQETFRLYDTHGFPPELTTEIAREHGLEVDMEGFEREMEAQRQRARAAQAFSGAMEMLPTYEGLGVDKVQFVGYERLSQDSMVTAILADSAQVGHASQGQQIEIVLKEAPFYAEGGGQVGDAGVIIGPNGRVRVEDTQAPVSGLIVHRGVVEEGDISFGDPVEARVDPVRRLDATRNHSGTHLLHAALRQVLGLHVRQAGSLVAPDRLRFDYSHVSPVSRDELLEIQSLVNQKVRDNLKVSVRESSLSQAVEEGALAFFGDKYGDLIRIVEMSNGERFSLEVCGGTHVDLTGQIGSLFVLGESSIGGGMRRVEAVTGRAAEQLFVERSSLLDSLSQKLETPLVDLEMRLDSFIQDTDRLRKRVEELERQSLRREARELVPQALDLDGMKIVAAKTSATTVEAMREMGDWLKTQLTSAVIVLAAVQDSRPFIVSMVTPDLVAKGLHAGNIAKETAQVLGGGGGGRPDMAQAGGKRADKLDEALRRVPELVRQSMH